MSNTIRNLLVKIGVDFTNAQKGFAQASRDLKKAGRQMQNTGRTLTKGLTVPIIAAVAGLTSLTIKAGRAADELLTLSQKTGLSTDALQEMEYAARFIDTELEMMTGSMMKLTKNMDMARQGSKDQREAFDMLNVSFKNADGTLRNAKDVWYDTIDALGQVGNEAERDAMALRLFGRSAADMNPLIKAGSSELRRLGQEAHTVGAVMSGDSVKALGKFDDSMQKLQAQFKIIVAEIAIAFLPLLQKFVPIVERYILPALKKFASWLGNLVDKFLNASPAMQKIITAMLALAVGIGPLLTVAGKLTTTIGLAAGRMAEAAKAGAGLAGKFTAMLGPAGMLALAIVAVVAAIVIFSSATDEAAKKIKNTNKEINSMVDASQKARKSFEESVSGIDSESAAAQKLADELFNLEKKQNKTNAEKLRMVAIVEELNKLVPNLSLAIDKETGALNLNEKAVRKVIAAKEEEGKAAAYAAEYARLTQEEIRLTNALQTAWENYQKAKEIYNADSIDLFKEEKKAMREAAQAHQDVYHELEAVRDALPKVSSEWYKLNGILSGTLVAIPTYTGQVVYAFQQVSEAAGQTAEDVEALLNEQLEYYESVNKRADEHVSSMGDIFDKEIEMYKITAKEVMANLKKQTEQFQKWGSEIKKLAGRVPQDVYDGLKELGPKASPLIEELNRMTGEQLSEFVAIWQGKTKAAMDMAAKEISGSIATTGVLGELWIQGIIDGMMAKGASLAKAAAHAAQKAKEAVSKAWVIQSPSKVAKQLGSLFSEGLGIGIMTGAKNAIKSAGQMARNVTKQLAFNSSMELSPAYAGVGNVDNDMYGAFSRALKDASFMSDVHIDVDGRTIAKATVNFMDKELQTKKINNGRAGGR